MSPYTTAILKVIRLIAGTLVMATFFLYAPDLLRHYIHAPAPPPPSHPWTQAGRILPLLAGVALFWKSRALAEHFDLD